MVNVVWVIIAEAVGAFHSVSLLPERNKAHEATRMHKAVFSVRLLVKAGCAHEWKADAEPAARDVLRGDELLRVRVDHSDRIAGAQPGVFESEVQCKLVLIMP